MFQEALDKTLRYRGIAGKQIAERTGISPSYVSEIRSGKRNPSLEMFERLLDAARRSHRAAENTLRAVLPEEP